MVNVSLPLASSESGDDVRGLQPVVSTTAIKSKYFKPMPTGFFLFIVSLCLITHQM